LLVGNLNQGKVLSHRQIATLVQKNRGDTAQYQVLIGLQTRQKQEVLTIPCRGPAMAGRGPILLDATAPQILDRHGGRTLRLILTSRKDPDVRHEANALSFSFSEPEDAVGIGLDVAARIDFEVTWHT
jgi:hypothetical protein